MAQQTLHPAPPEAAAAPPPPPDTTATTLTGSGSMRGGAALLVAPAAVLLPVVFALWRQKRIEDFTLDGRPPGEIVSTWGFAHRLRAAANAARETPRTVVRAASSDLSSTCPATAAAAGHHDGNVTNQSAEPPKD